MEVVVQLLASAVVGAVFGALASIATATRIATAREQARVREDARREVLAELYVYRAAVAGARGVMGRAPRPDPLTDEAARDFAERVIRAGTNLSRKQRAVLMRRLSTLVGPVQALGSAEVAHLPLDARGEQWRADTFLRIAERVPDGEKLTHGLIGKAHREGNRWRTQDAVTELDALIRHLGGETSWAA